MTTTITGTINLKREHESDAIQLKHSSGKRSSSSRVNKKSTGKRRFHRKSRKGCAACKRRRVKCDETKPGCQNCQRLGLDCVYLYPYATLTDKEKAMHAQKERELEVSSSERENSDSSQSQANQSIRLQQMEMFQQKQLQLQEEQQQRQQQRIQQQRYQQLHQTHQLQQQSQIRQSSDNFQGSQIQISQMAQMSQLSQISQMSQNSPVSSASQAPLSACSQGLPTPQSSISILPQSPQFVATSQFSMQRIPSYGLSSLLNQPSFNMASPLGVNDMSSLPPMPTLTVKPSTPSPVSSATPTPQQLAVKQQHQRDSVNASFGQADSPNSTSSGLGQESTPSEHLSRKGPALSPDIINAPALSLTSPISDLNLVDLRLMYHYTTKVWPTITDAGISDSKIWSDDIPMLAFKYPFLMHSLLAFSATHLSRTERGLDQCVTAHRAEALRLLREAVLEMSPENTDALVAAALILIMDSLANASSPTSTSLKSLPPSAWIFHVKGAATILTAVWPLSERSRFYKFISVDLGDLGDIGYDMISGELSNTSDNNVSNPNNSGNTDSGDEDDLNHLRPPVTMKRAMGGQNGSRYSTIECFDREMADLFPIPLNSPYFPTLAYMAKLHKERYKSDFILRIFAFPALLDKRFLALLVNCDLTSMRIMRCYYKLLRSFTEEMKDKVWFLEGVSSVLPVDVDQYSGGGGMHMMLDFLGGPSIIDDDGRGINDVAQRAQQSGLLDTNNLPSSSIGDSLKLDGNLNDDDTEGTGFIGIDDN
ncbi:hypothetical protein FOA43_003402 [Brettanomyces nanus]|uniref:Zn(2)-C6 fungal-type domain-containing protein n=1 Tax=Eeniella nana TaxID=13502 RepID=A0A875S3X3_EENNA|nr:uncharacterized protein FOA43_003402 [Brettanomyces nanus]QPG76016.1 hypothetical protein FOA43_003402 [Brettanomyces nanus]